MKKITVEQREAILSNAYSNEIHMQAEWWYDFEDWLNANTEPEHYCHDCEVEMIHDSATGWYCPVHNFGGKNED